MIAVDRLDLEVRPGEVFGFLGPNGAGKTTTVRMLCCLLAPTSGEAEVLGYVVGSATSSEAIRSRVGFLPESHGLYERLSAWKNLDFYARLYGVSEARRSARIEELLRMLEVWDRRDDAIATFSRGMRQKVALARAVVHDPDLVFLDEPTANLDPEAAHTIRELILSLRRSGRTIFLNTHNLDEVERVCDRIGVMRGHLLAVGAPRDLVRERFGRWTRILLARPSEEVSRRVLESGLARESHLEGSTLSVRTDDPESVNPAIARLVVAAGGDLVALEEVEVPLERFYLSLVGAST